MESRHGACPESFSDEAGLAGVPWRFKSGLFFDLLERERYMPGDGLYPKAVVR